MLKSKIAGIAANMIGLYSFLCLWLLVVAVEYDLLHQCCTGHNRVPRDNRYDFYKAVIAFVRKDCAILMKYVLVCFFFFHLICRVIT